MKVEATKLRDKFCVYKLLTFQYYFSKVVRPSCIQKHHWTMLGCHSIIFIVRWT